jgi:hypothetical protein
MDDDLIIRGKRIGPEELVQVSNVVREHWHRGRTAISQELCRLWQWRYASGSLKEQVCRLLLRQLEDRQLVRLPAPKRGISNHPNRRYYIPPEPEPVLCRDHLLGSLGDFLPVELSMVRRSEREELWNYLVYRYHYKSYRILVGAHLKYMAFVQDRPIACVAWSSSVFRIGSRDAFIGWDPATRSRNIRHIANNSRFLILPWVRIKNLASHLLGRCAKVLSKDWLTFYGHPLYLLETFVERSRFAGTCYQAANWIHVGQTKGHAKKNSRFYHHGQSKDVYLLPLVHDFRAKLGVYRGGGS